MNFIAKLLSLGHNYEDPDFDYWEMGSWYPNKAFKRTMARHIRELVGEGDSVLSLGCGSSPILNMFHCRKVGVDMNSRKLDFFRQYTDAELIEADITTMEPIGKFDIVLLTEVIEHVGYGNVDRVLSLVGNSLKIGGRAVISTPDVETPFWHLAERLLHDRESHPSLLFGRDLISRCGSIGLVFKNKRNWLWDTAFLFVKEF